MDGHLPGAGALAINYRPFGTNELPYNNLRQLNRVKLSAIAPYPLSTSLHGHSSADSAPASAAFRD